ncbi:4048_t:CDS:2, partial [Acaulospora morrowiae]
GFNNATPPMSGILHVEMKKNKWQKRYFYIKDGSLYHSKDQKGKDEMFLCSFVSFDVYACTKIAKKSKTKYPFALKSQDKISMFENPENDYVHFLCAESLEAMNNWILSIRAAKNNVMRQERPEIFVGIPEKNKPPVTINLDMPLTNALPVTVEESTSLMNEITFELAALNGSSKESPISPFQSGTTVQQSSETLRHHMRNPSGKLLGLDDFLVDHIPPVPTIKKESSEDLRKKESSGPFKGGSLLDYDEKIPPIKQPEAEVVTFVKGSLLASNEGLFEQAKEREKVRRAMGGVGILKDSNSSTFVQMEE